MSSEKLSPWYIALISVASLVIALLLVLAFAWSMGWLEDKELRGETTSHMLFPFFVFQIQDLGLCTPNNLEKHVILAKTNYRKLQKYPPRC